MLMSTLIASTSRVASGFAFRSCPKSALRTTSVVRHMTEKPGMPHDDENMPFYALGVNLAKQMGGQTNFKTLVDDAELEIVLEGFGDTMKGTSVADGNTILTIYGEALNKIIMERSSNINDRIKTEGDEFLANFLEHNEEAIKTESGMVYYPMTEGEGAQPSVSDTVEVHYHGTLVDGTVFDSSVDRGQTISFPLGNVIKGWQEGLAMMKEGGKATLIIPADLAYGDNGSGDVIPPSATLKFEVELFKVN
jgi:FKBP-type peptidyl-prolyl cis-trans isomerase